MARILALACWAVLWLTAGMLLVGNSMWSSPYMLSAFVALREKRLPFTVKTIALQHGEQHDPEFAKQSMTSRIPVLIDGEFALSESSAIIEYLEEIYPAPAHPRVLPSDVRERARARQIMAWLRSDLLPIREERSTQCVFFPHDQIEPLAPLSPAAVRAVEKLLAAADRLIPEPVGPLFGEWCIADTDLAMMLQRLLRGGDPVPERIRRYAQAQWDRPSVREFSEHERPAYEPARV